MYWRRYTTWFLCIP